MPHSCLLFCKQISSFASEFCWSQVIIITLDNPYREFLLGVFLNYLYAAEETAAVILNTSLPGNQLDFKSTP